MRLLGIQGLSTLADRAQNMQWLSSNDPKGWWSWLARSKTTK